MTVPTASSNKQGLDWIRGACRRFTESTGWPLVLSAADSPAVEKPDDDCLIVDLSDGTKSVGRLRLDLPPDARNDGAYLPICRLVELLAELVSRALAAERQLSAQSDEVTRLAAAGKEALDESDPRRALARLLEAAVELTGFRAAAFFLLNPAPEELVLRHACGIEAADVPSSVRPLTPDVPDFAALASGSTVFRQDEETSAHPWLPAGFRTAACVRIQSEAGPLGTLWAFDRRRRVPGGREMLVLEAIAAQTAALLERIVLVQESADGRRMRRDLTTASANQSAAIDLRTSAFPGFECASICTSRYELGGDLCELFPLGDDRTAIAVGDACGDSVPAAMVASSVRGALRALAGERRAVDVDAAEVVRRINGTLHAITPAHQFMSLLYGVYDAHLRSFHYCNAGHPTPLWVRRRRLRKLDSHGMLLGVLPDAEYDSSTIALEPGDLLVLFSDGISEAPNAKREMFGERGVARALALCPDASAQDVLASIRRRLEDFTAASREGDDRTLAVLRFGG